jgi:hypothetical protein
MNEHTKGEWRVSPVSWSETVIVADGFDHGICCLDINHATEESQEADGKVMAANAQLIAAAPDLLAALETLLNDPGQDWIRSTTWDKARAAIAKTTGDRT